MKHTGTRTEYFEFEHVLDQPQDYTEPSSRWQKTPPTVWRYTAVTVCFRRTQCRPEQIRFGPWERTISGVARNVLKSGELGQRRPASYDRHLADRDGVIEAWALPWLEPLVEADLAVIEKEAWAS